jgi:hypothetical protein
MSPVCWVMLFCRVLLLAELGNRFMHKAFTMWPHDSK